MTTQGEKLKPLSVEPSRWSLTLQEGEKANEVRAGTEHLLTRCYCLPQGGSQGLPPELSPVKFSPRERRYSCLEIALRELALSTEAVQWIQGENFLPESMGYYRLAWAVGASQTLPERV